MDRQVKDLTGTIYNNTLTALRWSHTHQKNAYWVFLCVCGNETTAAAHSVKRGDTKSCGCHRRKVSGTLNRSHGLTGSRLYRIWSQMKRRCDLPTVRSYPDYGGRGISVCKEWSDSFEVFYDWAINNGYRDDLTIDRENNDGNYEPGNCRWATMKQQAANRRPPRKK